MSDELKHHHMERKIVCPHCASIFDCSMGLPTNDDQEPPEDGNINVCVNCARVSLFDSKVSGGLRRPTDTEYLDLLKDKDVRRAISAVRATNYHFKRKAQRDN